MIHYVGSCDCLDCIKAIKCKKCGKSLIDQALYEIHQVWKHSHSNPKGLDEFLGGN